jgi:hypothetical protein
MATKAKRKPRGRQAGAVARVWQIATDMNGKERKEVFAAFAKAGINKHTALTQYQHWRNATPAARQAKLARWAEAAKQ